MFTVDFIDSLATIVADQVVAKLSATHGSLAAHNRLLSTEEAAAYLGLPSPSALRQRKAAGQIPESCYVKMGGSVLYDRQGLDAWIAELKDAA